VEARPDLRARQSEVVIRLSAAALNRRDLWITQGLYPNIRLPVIPGSDGAGTVAEVGAGADARWAGADVILNPGIEWGNCQRVQGPEFRILGMPDDGTFATHVVVPAAQLYPKPDHLSWPEAAALPLAGVTAYRALFVQGNLRAGERALITGIGGGVATMALQFAVAAGATVAVTSSSNAKLARARELGAVAGYLYTTENWTDALVRQLGPLDLVVDSAGGDGYGALINSVAPGGRIVNYGATAGPPARLDLFKLFWKQLKLIGSTMGSPADFAAMLQFVNRHRLTPVVDRVFPLEEGVAALERMKQGEQFGKLVLDTTCGAEKNLSTGAASGGCG
jgi:NADPH:quinone reductase-like Zn-dependent oxidoreductase